MGDGLRGKLADEEAIIRRMDAQEGRGALHKKLLLLALACITGIGAIVGSRYFSSTQKNFDAVQDLSTEAFLMVSDPIGHPLSLAASDLDIVRRYVKAQPGINFTIDVLDLEELGWLPIGASIINYEQITVALIRYQSRSEPYSPSKDIQAGEPSIADEDFLFHFIFAGKIDEVGTGPLQGTALHPFHLLASEKMNVLLWQSSTDAVSMFASNLNSQGLLRLAGLHH